MKNFEVKNSKFIDNKGGWYGLFNIKYKENFVEKNPQIKFINTTFIRNVGTWFSNIATVNLSQTNAIPSIEFKKINLLNNSGPSHI